MPLEFIKHNRPVSQEDIAKHGKYATHDIKVPVLLAYELGQILDKNGTVVNIDKAFIDRTLAATNKYINNKYNSPFSRLRSWFAGKSIDEIEVIPMIKNHKTDQVENLIGYSQGLLYTDTIEGVYSLVGHSLVTRIESKKDLENGLLRATSIGTRSDGSIKEISCVVNPAMPEGGFFFSENHAKPTETDPLTEKELQFAEQISALEFEEAEINNVIIPNHITLSKLIKQGKIPPWKYDELIKTTNHQALELMEHASIGVELGLMHGTFSPPIDMDSEDDKLVQTILNKYEKRTGKKTKKLEEMEKKAKLRSDSFIKKAVAFEDMRKKELKNILELCEHSPDVVSKYIKAELGETVTREESNDKHLNDWIQKSRDVRSKINKIKIELGEI